MFPIIIISLAFIPFKEGTLSTKIRWVRKKQKSNPTLYYKCYDAEAYCNGKTTYLLKNV